MKTATTSPLALRVATHDVAYLEEKYSVMQLKERYDETKPTSEADMALEELKQAPNLYGRLAASIAPKIHGHGDAKRALLLLLVGGLTKDMGNGMKIRGDVHICLMGDPGVAKSQLLKYIFKVAPRGVYTTGEDDGAIVLEDNGICCIDEFDKMKESDRTVICEVMKQQTVSSPGVKLDVQTSVLAAANPFYGRYNPKVSPAENINLPAALLSHFDLMFLITDEPTQDDDEELEPEFTTIDPMLYYFVRARQKRPVILPSVSEYITQSYGPRRGKHRGQEGANKALARLRFSNAVDIADVDEAARLMKASKDSFEARADDTMRDVETPTGGIFRLMKGMAARSSRRTMGRSTGRMDVDVDGQDASVMMHLLMADLRESALAKGFTESQLLDTIHLYESINVISCSGNGQYVWFLDTNKI